MKTVVLLFLTLTLVFARAEISFVKGWSLRSVPERVDDMKAFENENVVIIWAYDATHQSWKGFSPSKELTQKIADKNISSLESLQPYQAFWILSQEAWSASFESSFVKSPENSVIELKKGWNLVSLPQRVVVDETFFADALVWRYDGNLSWSVNDSSLDFPSLKEMQESDALWVKSEVDKTIDMSDALSQLKTFSSEEEMLVYIRSMIQSNRYMPYYGGGILYALNDGVVTPTVKDESTSSDATSTNLQEQGVDESDIVKNDGKYLYSLDQEKQQIFITSFENLAQKSYEPLATLPFKDKSVLAMYLQHNRLILISNNLGSGGDVYILEDEFGEKKSYPYYPSKKISLSVDTYDVSNILDIKLLSSYSIDGNYQESRIVDKKLFLVSSFYPEIEYEYPKVYVETSCMEVDVAVVSSSESMEKAPTKDCYQYSYDAKGTWKYDYENPIAVSENLLPYIHKGDTQEKLLKAERLFAPIKLNQSATLTTLSSFDIIDAKYDESISFVGDTNTYYASEKAFYLVSSEYPLYYSYENYKEQQMIYKFGIGESLEYRARGFVDGRMLSQFSMSEKDDYLRVATSSGFSWGVNPTVNSVYTMKEESERLEIKAELNGLGKEGELIKAVRFMGERGFVVTFKQTDPLYTLDMSDPEAPTIIGELSIPGFSNYLHIVDEKRVLSIGRDAEKDGKTLGLIVQLFDISDFANPQLADKVQIGTKNSYSPAEYNHKAFVFRSSDLMFALPYSEYNYSSNSSTSVDKLGVYQLKGMKIAEIKTIQESNASAYWYSEKRGVVFDSNGSSYAALIDGSHIVSESLEEEK